VTDRDRTSKVQTIARCQRRESTAIVSHHLEQALAKAADIGPDIHSALATLLASVRRREIEHPEEAA
jgi:hypothetical protein